MNEIVMPRLGFTMTTGIIVKWRKKEGDKVEKGDILLEVESDKVTVEVESIYAGILRKIIGKEGEEIPVQEVIGYIGEKDEEIPERVAKKAEIQSRKTEGIKAAEVKSGLGINAGEKKGRVKISPVARKIAEEMGIDYETEPITGTDPGGRISKDDVLAYAKSRKEGVKQPEKPEAGEIAIKSSVPIKGIRKVIAEKMSFAKTTIPHLILNIKADTTHLLKFREDIGKKVSSDRGMKLTYTDFLIKICATALRENLVINSSLQDSNFIIYDDINICLAVATEQGLIVPTLYQCDTLGLVDIAKKRNELVKKAREGKLGYRDVTNGTFTITNLGMFGIRSFSAIINPPQAAILAVGEIYSDTAVVGGKVEIRSFIDLSLSCDHRIIDGDVGAGFLQKVAEYIDAPDKLQLKL
ncbi:MAG: 2-oxo acid dehydrogenase subunit E2 [Spirochaetota bacterium]|nr:MAG: 2-oxo acid dehydrogenase subunit E2 [Spirochaetota bacterium]